MTRSLSLRNGGGLPVPARSGYVIEMSMFSFSRTYRVSAPDGAPVAIVERPWFRLRGELIVYADEARLVPLLVIRNRRVAALSMEHDLLDASSGRKLGSIRDRGLSAFFRDAWDILDDSDRPAGEMVEEGHYLLRRAIRILPGRHAISLAGRVVAVLQQQFKWFSRVWDLDLLAVEDPIEPNFAIACALVAAMADQRRQSR